MFILKLNKGYVCSKIGYACSYKSRERLRVFILKQGKVTRVHTKARKGYACSYKSRDRLRVFIQKQRKVTRV